MHLVKRVSRIVGGFALLVAGILMIVLPGPGWVTVALGLALLATEFVWAERALHHIKRVGTKGAEVSSTWLERFRRRFGRAS